MNTDEHRSKTLILRLCLSVFICGFIPFGCQPTAETGDNSTARRLDAGCIAAMEAAIWGAIHDEIPGAVVVIGDGEGVLYREALGSWANVRHSIRLESHALFDVASLTKPVATATSITKLVEQGKLRLDDRVADFIPEYAASGKGEITIGQLLLHTSGLIADNPLSDYEGGREVALESICALELKSEPGERFEYSDVGYIVLGELVRRIDGRGLEVFTREELFLPLGMEATLFLPAGEMAQITVPTEKRDGRWLDSVHDPRAAALGGVAGHAGLYSRGDDLARFCRMILNEGELDGVRVFNPETVRQMTKPRTLPGGAGLRSYGFDVDTANSTPRGLRMKRGVSFGHTGFTGTSFWIDPANDLFVILLTSRLQMPGGGRVQELREIVGTLAAEAVLGADSSRVLTGIDALVLDDFKPLKGRRVGLITNQTGVDRFGRRTIDLLHRAKGVELVAIFSPEHGVTGTLNEEKIGDARDAATGLTVYSLYGETRRPTDQMLRGIDTLVFDIQDAGTRFYTYITTMGYAMEECERRGIRFVVLDRPNPIGAMGPQGPMSDADNISFVNYKPLPLVHGMTVGELAGYFRDAYIPKLDLQVVKMHHYRRDMGWEETQLKWTPPSPNLRTPGQATLYPALGLLEMTNVSVGRGTETPFEIIGAPWIDGQQLADALKGAGLPGVRFEAVEFTPKGSKYEGERCEGVRLEVFSQSLYQPSLTGLTIARALLRLYPEQWESEGVMKLLCSDEADRVWRDPEGDLDMLRPSAVFLAARKKVLLYSD